MNDISTVPKDGTPVLLIDVTAEDPVWMPCKWNGKEWIGLVTDTDSVGRVYEYIIYKPTHWEKYPEIPKAK